MTRNEQDDYSPRMPPPIESMDSPILPEHYQVDYSERHRHDDFRGDVHMPMRLGRAEITLPQNWFASEVPEYYQERSAFIMAPCVVCGALTSMRQVHYNLDKTMVIHPNFDIEPLCPRCEVWYRETGGGCYDVQL